MAVVMHRWVVVVVDNGIGGGGGVFEYKLTHE